MLFLSIIIFLYRTSLAPFLFCMFSRFIFECNQECNCDNKQRYSNRGVKKRLRFGSVRVRLFRPSTPPPPWSHRLLCRSVSSIECLDRLPFGMKSNLWQKFMSPKKRDRRFEVVATRPKSLYYQHLLSFCLSRVCTYIFRIFSP